VRRLLGEASYGARARELGEWARLSDGAASAADLVERLAAGVAVGVAKPPLRG
jgi:UDP:flavonoid glycosyltransferase YjiC (YdhE family)